MKQILTEQEIANGYTQIGSNRYGDPVFENHKGERFASRLDNTYERIIEHRPNGLAPVSRAFSLFETEQEIDARIGE